MVKYEDYCVGCPPEKGCLGRSCPNKNVPVYTCDECGCDDEPIYRFEGQELCINCVKDRLEIVNELY